MKKITIQLFVIGLIALALWGCSTKKDAFLNRALHSTATKYNVLYNGNMAFDAAKKQIDDAYEDDFWQTLPIEPLKVEEKFVLPTPPGSKQSSANLSSGDSQGFKRAEEKAVKAVQKHSMSISGSEKNKQIDDAYFLLGRARYYDQRFVPALETFKYMIKKYPGSKLFNEARVWEAKTLIRLGSEDEAIYKLDKYLTKTKELPDRIREDAHTALAMAYTEQDSTQQVINHLNKALLYSKKNYHQETRNSFVLGQLYRQQDKIDSSNVVFEKIATYSKAPYRYKIYAQIERAKNYNKEVDDTESMLANLEKLTRNRDNRPFLDGIYFQLGKINLKNDSTDVALNYFKESILTKLAKDVQKDYAYEEVGNIYFDKANFQNAGAYYDSVLNITKNKNTKRIKKIERKRKSLDEVIRLENIAHTNDSILGLVAMSDKERDDYFTDYIKALKKKDEELRIIEENKTRERFSGFGGDDKKSNKGSLFYFYNSQTMGFGVQQFKQVWGNRPLEDNWRISNKKVIQGNTDADDTTTASSADEETEKETRKYEVAYYLEKIPSDEKVLDSISKTRNKAYYNLGLIYKEQFNKYELATTRLENLLQNDPQEKLILPSYYHLYKAYEKFDQVKSDYYKDKIVSEYPDSRYAQFINNPDLNSEDLENKNSPEEIYKSVYTLYTEEKYQETLDECNKYVQQLTEAPIIPKFELLKAHTIAKIEGKEGFVKALTYVLTNYPNTEEGVRASEILAFLRGERPPKQEEKNNTKKIPATQKEKEKLNNTKKNQNLPSKKEMMERIRNNKKGKKG